MPPKFVDKAKSDRESNLTVNQGQSIVLPCNVEGDPLPSFSWFKDGSPLSPLDLNYIVRDDGHLEIFAADVTDTASYKCVASNVAGEVEKDVVLYVQGWLNLNFFIPLVSMIR